MRYLPRIEPETQREQNTKKRPERDAPQNTTIHHQFYCL